MSSNQEQFEFSPFALRAADCIAKIIDEMIRDGKLDARSPLADARLDYGMPWVYEHSKEAKPKSPNNGACESSK